MSENTGLLAQYKVLPAADLVIKNKRSFHISPPQKVLQYWKRVENESANDKPPYSVSIKYLQQTMSSRAVFRFQAKGIN